MRKTILTVIDWIAAGITFFTVMVLAIYAVFVATIRSLIQFVKEMWSGHDSDTVILFVMLAAIIWCVLRWKAVRHIL